MEDPENPTLLEGKLWEELTEQEQSGVIAKAVEAREVIGQKRERIKRIRRYLRARARRICKMT